MVLLGPGAVEGNNPIVAGGSSRNRKIAFSTARNCAPNSIMNRPRPKNTARHMVQSPLEDSGTFGEKVQETIDYLSFFGVQRLAVAFAVPELRNARQQMRETTVENRVFSEHRQGRPREMRPSAPVAHRLNLCQTGEKRCSDSIDRPEGGAPVRFHRMPRIVRAQPL